MNSPSLMTNSCPYWFSVKREENKRVAVKALASVGWTAEKISKTIIWKPSTER